ncbi:MAG: HAD family hydrolase [Pyrobaculum sp.]
MYVFDLDGTLVDSVDAHIAAWIEALELFGVRKEIDEVKPYMGLPALEIAKRLHPAGAFELAAFKNRLFLEKYISYVKLYEDAAVLKYIQRPVAVVTSSSGYVAREILRTVGLLPYVDLVIGGDEVPRGKPAPDPLYKVAEYFSIAPRDMVVVGDTDYDMAMAKNAGAVGVCIQRGGGSCREADRVITTLYELL